MTLNARKLGGLTSLKPNGISLSYVSKAKLQVVMRCYSGPASTEIIVVRGEPPLTTMSTRSLRTYFLVALLALILLKAYAYASNVENQESMDNLRSLVVSVSCNRRMFTKSNPNRTLSLSSTYRRLIYTKNVSRY